MKKRIALLAMIALLCAVCGAAAEKGGEAEILAVFFCPEAQIITEADHSKELADTVVFLYHDFTYIQYVDHDDRYEIYSGGTFEVDFDWNAPGWQYDSPHILTIHAQRFHTADHVLETADLTYDINLDRVADYCLYPNNIRPDLKLTAAFMQVNKQKLAKADGSEEYLPTIWFYYDDGSFEQYAIVGGQGVVLFSSGDYAVTDPGFTANSVLTIHRTMKYRDGTGLAGYDSTHDYVIGELDFIRIWPAE